MAQRSTIYRVCIDLADTDRQVYEEIRLSVARADSETAHRLVARLLAYCLFYERDIAFTGGVGAGDEPDIWVKLPDGRIKAWIEVGLPDPKRLLKAARHCGQVILLAYGRRLPSWEAESIPLLIGQQNVTVIELDGAFLDGLLAGLDRNINWSLTVSGGTLYLTSGASQTETTPSVIIGPAGP